MLQYEINGKSYEQRPLVLGQIKQLTALLENATLPATLEPQAIALLIADKLPHFLAIVLTEKGRSPKDKNIEELAEELEFSVEADTAAKVVEDFFGLNPLASLFEKLAGTVEGIKAKMPETASPTSSSSLQVETSQSGTKSSGTIPPPSASPGQNTEAES